MADMCSTSATEQVSVLVKFLSVLRDRMGVGAVTVALPRGSTLRAVSSYLAQEYGLRVPGDNVIATLNGHGWQQTAQGLDTRLLDGDVIHIFPPIAGG